MTTETSQPTSDRELVITRTFNAPRTLVFAAFTEAEQLAQWWGPKEWTTTVNRHELRPGGVWHYCFRSPEGEEAWGIATYQEITPPERLVFVDAFSDAEGNTNPPETETTITLEEQDGRTLMTMRSLFDSPEIRASMIESGMADGLGQSFDRLEELLARA